MVMTRNNGHNEGLTGDGYKPRSFGQGQVYSALKYLVRPGETVESLLMVCNFRDESQFTYFIRAVKRYAKFNQTKHLEMARMWLAGSDSIKAERTQKLLEAVVGYFRASKMNPNRNKTLMKRYAEQGSSMEPEGDD